MIFLEIDNIKYFENIIDLRDENKFVKRNIPGSINISYQKLLIYPEKYLTREKEYLLICDYGIKSKRVSEILNKMGYHTYSLKNGFRDL